MNKAELQEVSSGVVPRETLTKSATQAFEERIKSLTARGYYSEYQHEKKEQRRFVKLGSPEYIRAKEKARYQAYPNFFEFPPKDHDNEPNRIADFRADFDKDGDVGCTIEEAHEVIDYCSRQYGIDTNEWRIWFSGGKGVHLELLAPVLGLEDGYPKLPLIYKALARELVEVLKLTTVDLSIYCMRTGKPFRREGIQRENGNYKVPVTLDELVVENHDSFIEKPRQLADERPGLRNENLATKIQKIIEEIGSKDQYTNTGVFWEHDSEDDPPCIKTICNNRKVTAGKCDFNFCAMTLTRYALNQGLPCEEAVEKFAPFIAEFPSSSLQTLQARKENFRNRYHSMDLAGAEFGCGYARALGLQLGCEFCSYFDTDLEQRKDSAIETINQLYIERKTQNRDLKKQDWVPLLLKNGLENESDLLDTLKTRFNVTNPVAAIKEGLKRKKAADFKEKADTEGKTIIIDRPERSLVAEEIAKAIISKFKYRLIRCNGLVCYPDVSSLQATMEV